MKYLFNYYYNDLFTLIRDLKYWNGDLSRVTINYHARPNVFVATMDSLQTSADDWISAEKVIKEKGTLKLLQALRQKCKKENTL